MKPADLQRWRKRLGLTQREVMEAAGNPSPTAWRTWQSWEIGQRPVPWYVPAVIAFVEDSLRERG